MTVALALLIGGAVLAGGCGLRWRWAPPWRGIALSGVTVLALILVVGVAFASAFGFRAWAFDVLIALLAAWIVAGPGGRDGRTDDLPPVPILLFFALAAMIFLAPALILPVPLDTDAQGFGYLALTVREGGTLTTLAPFHPEIEYLYSPGFPILIAYLTARTGIPIHQAQMAMGAALAILFVWLAYDFGIEAGGKRIGGGVSVATIAGFGLFTAYMDSHYTTLLALVFGLAFLTFALRVLRGGRWQDVVAAVVTLAALPISHPDTTIIVAIGYVPWVIALAAKWLLSGGRRVGFARLAKIAVGIPMMALVLITPWLVRIAHLLGGDVASPFEISIEHWKLLVFMHGVVIPALAFIGAAVALRNPSDVDVLMLVWLVAVIEFSTLGLLERTFPFMDALLKYDYPFSIAWHGPIIPYAYLSARGIAWVAERIGRGKVERLVMRVRYPVMAVIALGVVALVAFSGRLLAFSKGRLWFYGAFSSHADVVAMLWLRENAPTDARILNYPANYEGHWAPVITERDAVYFRPQPFFVGAEGA